MREKNQKNVFRVPRISTGLFLLVAAAIVFGCSSSENKSTKAVASNPKGKLDACAVLTAEEAAEVLGDKVTKSDAFPRTTELEGGKKVHSVCSYDAVSSDRSLGLNITYAPMYKGKYPKTLAEFTKSRTGGGPPDETAREPVAVSGVGDFAVWSINYGVGMLVAYSGEYHAIITIGSMSKSASDNDMEPAKTAAKKVLGKL
jgi:hypothetical protein